MTQSKGIAGLAAVVALCATGALAQDEAFGKALYDQYCATCHGASAAGDGPLTEFITDKVPDLTGLAQRNDGDFPMLKVIHIIDGRTGLRGHGGPMPTYGSIFMHESLADIGINASVLETRGRIMSLAMYLESLQG